MPKKNGKFTFDKNMTREQFLAQFGNDVSQPAESTGNAIAGGMKAEAILDAVRRERGRRAAVVAAEKSKLEKKGRLSWRESQTLDAYNNAGVNEAYRYTNEYRDNMSLGERLLDAPKYKMNSSAGAIELFSPNPANYGNIKFLKNIKGMPYFSGDGSVSLANPKKIFGNFTTDVPFRLHPMYPSMPGGELLVIEPSAFRGKTPWSIHPMDTFFRSNELTGFDPKDITLISGNEQILNDVSKLGMNTRTNQNLVSEYSRIADWAKARGKAPYDWEDTPFDLVSGYRKVLDNEMSAIGRPSIVDYRNLESITGLKSHTSDDVVSGMRDLASALGDASARRVGVGSGKRTLGTFIEYPDGHYSDFYTFNKSKDYIRKQLPFYENVYYDTIPTAEDDVLKMIGGHGGQDYDPYYEPYLRQLFEDRIKSNPLKRNGGGIHIKPENRGKFTALKKRTGHSATWFKEHGTPAQKKMAVFALNSRRWSHNHSDGGYLLGKIYDLSQEEIDRLISLGYEVERV